MNQEKIGKFIAECRKEKNLTQLQLSYSWQKRLTLVIGRFQNRYHTKYDEPILIHYQL